MAQSFDSLVSVSRKYYQNWYSQNSHEFTAGKDSRTIYFFTSFIILKLILCMIVGKISSQTEEKIYWVGPLEL